MQEEVEEKRNVSLVAIGLCIAMLFCITTENIKVLIGIGGFLSLVAASNFIGETKTLIGLTTSQVRSPDAHTLSLLFTYSTCLATLFLHYPVWAAAMLPWIVQAAVTNFIGWLYAIGYIEFINTEDDE